MNINKILLALMGHHISSNQNAAGLTFYKLLIGFPHSQDPVGV